MTISAAMQQHLAGTTTLAVFLKITARDGTIVRVCNTTRNKILGGELYYAYPIVPTTVETSNGLKADNFEVTAIFSQFFTSANLRAKKWMGARVEYRVMNYRDFSMGPAVRRVGFIGETTVGRHSAKPEIDSLSQKLSQSVGRTFNELCDVDELGDSRCKVNLNGLTATGYKIRGFAHVAATANPQQFTVAFDQPIKPDNTSVTTAPDNLYRFGKFVFTSGANAGVEGQIIKNSGNFLTVFLSLFYPIAAGDALVLTTGCDRSIAVCRDLYANAENNRSFWCLPGRSKLLTIPS